MANSGGVPGNHGQLDSFDDLNESVRIAQLGFVVSRVGVIYRSDIGSSGGRSGLRGGVRFQDVSSIAKSQLVSADSHRLAVTISNHGPQIVAIYAGEDQVARLATGATFEMHESVTSSSALWAIAEPKPATFDHAHEGESTEWDDGWHADVEDVEDSPS